MRKKFYLNNTLILSTLLLIYYIFVKLFKNCRYAHSTLDLLLPCTKCLVLR